MYLPQSYPVRYSACLRRTFFPKVVCTKYDVVSFEEQIDYIRTSNSCNTAFCTVACWFAATDMCLLQRCVATSEARRDTARHGTEKTQLLLFLRYVPCFEVSVAQQFLHIVNTPQCYSGICMVGLGKTSKIINQDSPPPSQDLNAGSSENKADFLTERSRLEVDGYVISNDVIRRQVSNLFSNSANSDQWLLSCRETISWLLSFSTLRNCWRSRIIWMAGRLHNSCLGEAAWGLCHVRLSCGPSTYL
jgi:hypothetical protein